LLQEDHMMPTGLVIQRFDPVSDSGSLDAWVACALASERHVFGDAHTAWTARELREKSRVDTNAENVFILARRDGEVLGAGLVVMPLRDNLHFAEVSLDVHPDHRRSGVGSTLLQEMEAVAAERGRTSLRAESSVRVGEPDPADSFAVRHGYRNAQVDLRSDLELPDDLDRLLSPLEREAARFAGDYDVLTWWDDVPQEWREERARCAVHMSTDAPAGDVDVQEESWDADRIATLVDQLRAQGRRLVETVAVHRPSGRIAAFTDLVVPAHMPTMAFQWDTLVLSEHRGHRLGQLVKATNLRVLRDGLPEVQRVCTWNAVSNAPMLRVNRAMGFRPVGRTTEWLKQMG
jgi:GNAT superfamily N-acetyltransferase